MTHNWKIAFQKIIVVCLSVVQIGCLQTVESRQLHRTFSETVQEYGIGLRELAILFTGIIFGILCFLCVMYNLKWRRESGWNFSFAEIFKDNEKPQAQSFPSYKPQKSQNYPTTTYYSTPNIKYQGQPNPTYYNAPKYTNYPPL